MRWASVNPWRLCKAVRECVQRRYQSQGCCYKKRRALINGTESGDVNTISAMQMVGENLVSTPVET
jgi:hypothetical protein